LFLTTKAPRPPSEIIFFSKNGYINLNSVRSLG
jgi:hypothetical protein